MVKSSRFKERIGRAPKLTVIMAGNDPASKVYVGNKEKSCRKAGIESRIIELPEEVEENFLLDCIIGLNRDDTVDGILVQLPLPAHINSDRILETISTAKDVDGFNPHNIGLLWTGKYRVAPCTPAGITVLLDEYGIDVSSMNCVIMGRSNIVGKPMAALLLERNATVTVTHSRTRNPASICREADILVAAIGKPAFITEDFIKDGAILIDIGINPVQRKDAHPEWLAAGSPLKKSFDEKGYRLIGDIEPLAAMEKSSFYTPVPGGVGRMTVAMLLQNTIKLAYLRNSLE